MWSVFTKHLVLRWAHHPLEDKLSKHTVRKPQFTHRFPASDNWRVGLEDIERFFHSADTAILATKAPLHIVEGWFSFLWLQGFFYYFFQEFDIVPQIISSSGALSLIENQNASPKCLWCQKVQENIFPEPQNVIIMLLHSSLNIHIAQFSLGIGWAQKRWGRGWSEEMTKVKTHLHP